MAIPHIFATQPQGNVPASFLDDNFNYTANYTATGTGAAASTVIAQLNNTIWVTNYFANGVSGALVDPTGVVDSTAGIQAAINQAGLTNTTVFFPPGVYKISGAGLTIVNGCRLEGVFQRSTLLLATQNMTGITVGNGTSGGQNTSKATVINNITFNPLTGITAFASGSCIFLNFVFYCRITNCTFYGLDSTVKLFNGVNCFQASECWVTHSYFISLGGNGILTLGNSGVANETIDCRFDFNEFTAITGDCVFVGAFTAGCTFNYMIAFNYTAWGLHFNCPTPAGTLHYVAQPDFECDNLSGGIYCQQVSNVTIEGGWIGVSSLANAKQALWVGSQANGVRMTGTQLLTGYSQIDGPNCTLTGCDIVGDNVTPTNGLLITSTGIYTGVTGCQFRQHPNAGITFTGYPDGCTVVGTRLKSNGSNATSFTGTISGGTTLTVSAVTGTLVAGQIVSGAGVTPGTTIVSGSGLSWVIQPSQGAVGPEAMTGIGANISGLTGWSTGSHPPVIRDNIDDSVFFVANTATLTLSPGRSFIQLSGTGTTVTNLLPIMGQGARITIQCNAGGNTFANGSGSGALLLKGSPLTVAGFFSISFICDGGNTWFEDGGSYV